jgi:hypothetical protein
MMRFFPVPETAVRANDCCDVCGKSDTKDFVFDKETKNLTCQECKAKIINNLPSTQF